MSTTRGLTGRISRTARSRARRCVPATSTSRPSARSRIVARSSATKSTTFSSTASVSVIETLSRTAFSAHSTLRPRRVAIDSTNDTAKFSTFVRMSPSMSSPSPGHRMRRADRRARRHRGHVRRHRDEHARRGRTGAARRNVDDDGHGRAEHRLDDVLRRREQPARRIELHDQGAPSLRSRPCRSRVRRSRPSPG